MVMFSFFSRTRCSVFVSLAFLTLSVMVLPSCKMLGSQLKSDREGGMEMQDYRDAMATRLPDTNEDRASAGRIPDLQPYIAQSSERMKSMPLVSISVNQSVPIRDVLYELAQQADYDLELDPRIKGSIIFTARNRPFDVVIERISDMTGLRYKFEDDILRIELDTPYSKIYKIDYLNYVRSAKSSASNNISVVQGEGADSGSEFEASSESEADFWGELDTNLTHILGATPYGALKTKKDPRITAVDQTPNVQAVSPEGSGNVNVQPPNATLRVESLPVDGGSDDEDEEVIGLISSGSGGEGALIQGTFQINKQAGLISVYATEKAHKEVANYLQLLKRSVTSQVLVEAKILEVTLSDEYETGIDWSFLNPSGSSSLLSGELTFGVSTIGQIASPVLPANSNIVTAAFNGNDVQTLINAVSAFGTVKALASPRMTVLNNQAAVLNVATNRVFFEVDVETTVPEGGGDPQTDVDSEIRNVPEGVLVSVQPSIDLEGNTISLSVRPTVTNVVNSIDNPALAFAIADCGAPCANITAPVPELNVQEIDSVLKVRSGQPVVMGGLLQDRAQSAESGVPVLSDTPVFGNLFKAHDDSVSKTELVIFLKATILDTPGDSVHNTDKDLYRTFSSDRRPLRF